MVSDFKKDKECHLLFLKVLSSDINIRYSLNQKILKEGFLDVVVLQHYPHDFPM